MTGSPGVKDSALTFDGNGELLTPSPPKKIDLRDHEAIRRELAAVYRDVRAGRIETQEATRLGYLLDLLGKSLERGALADRLELLELTLKVRKSK